MLDSHVPVWSHWVPMPGLGSVVGLGRAWFSPNPQDFSSGVNQRMRDLLLEAMERAREAGAGPLVHAAGHEHSLQVFESDRGPRYLVVSGLGSREKATPVRHGDGALFAHSHRDHPGFVTLDFLRDGRVRLGVVEWVDVAPGGVEV